LLGRCFITWAIHPVLFALVILDIWNVIFAWAKSEIFLFYASHHSWDDRHMLPCLAFFCWNGVLPWLARKKVILLISASQMARIIGLGHHALWQFIFIFILFFSLFSGTRDWTQGLTHTSRVFSHWTTLPASKYKFYYAFPHVSTHQFHLIFQLLVLACLSSCQVCLPVP
jgi:hypothetical protein